MPVIGFLSVLRRRSWAIVSGHFAGPERNGYVEGENVAIEYRWAEVRPSGCRELAADLVRHRSRLSSRAGAPAVLGGQGRNFNNDRLSFGGDPVGLGLVASLARPGGNLTGIKFFQAISLQSGLACCASWCPGAIALPCSSTRPLPPCGRRRETRSGGSRPRLANPGPSKPAPPRDRAAFATLRAKRPDALFVARRPLFQRPARPDRCAPGPRHATPATYAFRSLPRGRPDELRQRHYRYLSPGRHLYRSHPQGCQAR